MKLSQITEAKAEYQGREVELEKPFRTPGESKKFAVYVKNDKGNIIKVRFGDPDLSIKRDQPERLKSFRARHKCDEKTDKTKPSYWSCKFWEKDKTVTDLLSEASLYLTAIARHPKSNEWLFWNGKYFTKHEDERVSYKQKSKFKDAETEAKDMGYKDYQLVDRPIWLPGVK